MHLGHSEGKPNFIAEIKEFLEAPWDYLRDVPYENSAYFFLVNPQFLFFGKPSYLLGDEQKRAKALVNAWIQEIENDFEFILILEHFDRSLVLFVLKFCWDIRDVAYIKKLFRKKRSEFINILLYHLPKASNAGVDEFCKSQAFLKIRTTFHLLISKNVELRQHSFALTFWNSRTKV